MSNQIFIGVDYGVDLEGDSPAAVAIRLNEDGTQTVIASESFDRGTTNIEFDEDLCKFTSDPPKSSGQ